MALAQRGVQRPVAALVTRTLVDEQDPAFGAPSKPIGRYVTELVDADARRAEDALAEKGYRLLAHELSSFAEQTVHLEDDAWPESP